MNKKLKVSELVFSIKNLLESNYRVVHVEGEISNLTQSTTGHWYFTLSDKESSISCAFFKGDALKNPEIKKVKDGEKVSITGSINVYHKRGTFQVVVKSLSGIGKGNLKEEFEKLKKKLSAEGLFDMEFKKTIPVLPKKIAIITAPKGAAVQDFINVYRRRSLWHNLVVIPSVVQGAESSDSIISSIKKAHKINADIIVITRGGGSLEDLWSFNDESLIREIFNSKIPVVSAIGHQVDYTLCDYVSDLRCETPTAAAEMLTQPQIDFKQRLSFSSKQLLFQVTQIKNGYKSKMTELSPRNILEILWSKLNAMKNKLNVLKFDSKLFERTMLYDNFMLLDDFIKRLKYSCSNKINYNVNKLENLNNLLLNLNPNSVLSRGYSYISDERNRVLSSSKEFDKIVNNGRLSICFYDGERNVIKVDS